MNLFYENKTMDLLAAMGDHLAFDAHLHHHIEFVYMLEGSAIGVVDSNEYIIQKNDAFIAFPNQIHHYRFLTQEKYILLIFPPEMCGELIDVFRNKRPQSSLIHCEAIQSTVLFLLEQLIQTNESPTKYDVAIRNGYLLALMGTLFNLMCFEERKTDSNLIKNILLYCNDHYTKPLQLAVVAKAMHVNKCYLSQLFHKKLKMSFIDYINMLRISDACKLLQKNEESITNIAYSVGFNSPRSFNRAFLKYVHMTPRAFQKKNF